MPSYKNPPTTPNMLILTFKGRKDPGLGFRDPAKGTWWVWTPNFSSPQAQAIGRFAAQIPGSVSYDTDTLPHHFVPFEENLLSNWCHIGGLALLPEIQAAQQKILGEKVKRPKTFHVAITDGWEVNGKVGSDSKAWCKAYTKSDAGGRETKVVKVAIVG